MENNSDPMKIKVNWPTVYSSGSGEGGGNGPPPTLLKTTFFIFGIKQNLIFLHFVLPYFAWYIISVIFC